MSRYSLTHVSNGALLQTLSEEVAFGRQGTAEVLALIAEVEKRRLYREAGCSSMYVYCVERLKFSEDEANKRIHASRAARRFPIIFDLVADGRLHLTGVCVLRPHLTPASANSLLRASIHKTRKQIEQLIADRSPRPDVPTVVVAVAPAGTRPSDSANGTQPVPASGDRCISSAPEHTKFPENSGANSSENSPAPLKPPAPQSVAPPLPPPHVAPLGAERYALQLTLTKPTHDLLRRAQDLLGSQVPAGDLDTVLRRGLELLVAQLEKKKFAATQRPSRASHRLSGNLRHIPARVKRSVWNRDGGQCTFVGDGGKRCDCRRDLEFDHIVPAGRGGEASASNIRLLCRAHNQLEAERAYGAVFMEGKRQAFAHS